MRHSSYCTAEKLQRSQETGLMSPVNQMFPTETEYVVVEAAGRRMNRFVPPQEKMEGWSSRRIVFIPSPASPWGLLLAQSKLGQHTQGLDEWRSDRRPADGSLDPRPCRVHNVGIKWWIWWHLNHRQLKGGHYVMFWRRHVVLSIALISISKLSSIQPRTPRSSESGQVDATSGAPWCPVIRIFHRDNGGRWSLIQAVENRLVLHRDLSLRQLLTTSQRGHLTDMSASLWSWKCFVPKAKTAQRFWGLLLGDLWHHCKIWIRHKMMLWRAILEIVSSRRSSVRIPSYILTAQLTNLTVVNWKARLWGGFILLQAYSAGAKTV